MHGCNGVRPEWHFRFSRNDLRRGAVALDVDRLPPPSNARRAADKRAAPTAMTDVGVHLKCERRQTVLRHRMPALARRPAIHFTKCLPNAATTFPCRKDRHRYATIHALSLEAWSTTDVAWAGVLRPAVRPGLRVSACQQAGSSSCRFELRSTNAASVGRASGVCANW